MNGGGVPLLCINELFKIDGCGYLPRHKERQTLGTRRDVYNLVFFFSVRVDLFRHNGIHPGREAQFVDPEETESELQQQRRDIHTATRAREMQILFVKNKAPPSLCVIQPLPLKRHEEYTEQEVKRLRGRWVIRFAKST